jgi:hypothetical protein
VLINIFGLLSFYYFSNTPHAIEVRRIPQIKVREKAKMLEEWRKTQESSS